MRLVLDHTETLADDISTFWFKPDGRFRYTAGEFVEVTLPHDSPDDRGDTRWFTLSSSPSEPLVAITSTFTAHGGSSFKQTLRALKVGDALLVSEPMGDFVVPKLATLPLVFVAGGIGSTPVRSITKWLTDTGDQRDIYVIYSIKTIDAPFVSELRDAYGERLLVWESASGRLTAADILAFTNKPADALYYMAGPETMIELLSEQLQAQGIASRDIVTDYFPGYTD